MNQSAVILPRKETQRYALMGMAIGFLFPLIATITRVLTSGLPLRFSNILAAQISDPLLWIIDSAPVMLGIFAMLIGQRQERLNQREMELHRKEEELGKIHTVLEGQVEERTKNIEKRFIRLRIAAEIAKDAAFSKNINDLLDNTSLLIQNRFNFYHTGIFLLDNNNEFAVLTASPTEAGRQMIANGYKSRIGKTDAVGRAAESGESRIISDIPDAALINNPRLLNTRSEMVLPLKAGNRVLGVLDIHSDQPRAFGEDDLIIMQVLTDQIAATIERTRLLQQEEENVKELEKAYGRVTRESWSSLIQSGNLANHGYRFDNIRIHPINESPMLGNKAMQEGKLIMEDDGNNKQNLFAIPIKLRGQSIGAVTIRLKEEYNPLTITLLEQAIERLAASLESARLYEEARLRADREQAISQVTAAIGSAPEFDSILRTTIEEIGKSLGDSDVSIQIIGDTEQS